MRGTHGTCGHFADQIDADGELKPSTGKNAWRGTGVYLWEVKSSDGAHEVDLARLWWKSKKWPEDDNSCAIYKVSISDKVSTLNYRDSTHRDAFLQFAQKAIDASNGRISRADGCEIFDMYVKHFESATGKVIRIVKAEDYIPNTDEQGANALYLFSAYPVLVVLDNSCVEALERLSTH